MASEVDVCNLSLAHLGNAAEVTSISPPDGTAEADHCVRFYPIARDECLEYTAWTFATRREALALLSENPQPERWGFAYALPNQCIRVLAVLNPLASDDAESEEFEIETLDGGGGVIYSNAEEATVRFIWRQEDPVRFSPAFIVALSYKLAASLAGPVLKDTKAKRELEAVASVKLSDAAAMDARQRKSARRKDFIPAHLKAR